MKKRLLHWIVIFLAAAFLVSCGSGGGNSKKNGSPTVDPTDGSTTTDPSATTPDDNSATGHTVSGVASKGPVLGGTVTAWCITDGAIGAQIGETTTDSTDGSYSIDLGDYTGPVLIQVTGGTYKNEADGSMVSLTVPLKAVVPSAENDIQVAITPLTDLAAYLAEKAGLSVEAISSANALISQLLGQGEGILAVQPIDPTSETASGSATEAQIEYSLALAAISVMATTGGTVDIETVLNQIKEDLSDNKLDQTGGALGDALDDFIEDTEQNKTGVTSSDDTAVAAAIKESTSTGFEPTGNLADAKTMLLEIINTEEENPQEVADLCNDFIAYMTTFVEPSPEAHLFIAAAMFADLYNHEAMSFITSPDGLNINYLTDFDNFYTDEEFRNLLINKLISAETDIIPVFQALEDKLNALDAELIAADGASFSLSLTGFDTVYFDSIDVKIMRTFVNTIKLPVILAQAMDLNVENWYVTNGETTSDIRTLSDVSDPMTEEFVLNNEDLFTYSTSRKATKLAAFKSTISTLQALFNSVYTALDALGEAGRRNRSSNAFNLDTEFGLVMIKFIAEESLPSLIDALDDPGKILLGVIVEDGKDTVYIEGDYAYSREIADIFTQPVAPIAGEITVKSLFSGDESTPRDVFWEKWYDDDYTPYTEEPPTLYMADVADTEWDAPMDVIPVPLSDAITIDGTESDWAGIEPIFQSSDLTVKLARSSSDSFYGYMKATVDCSEVAIGSDYYGIYLSTWNNNTYHSNYLYTWFPVCNSEFYYGLDGILDASRLNNEESQVVGFEFTVNSEYFSFSQPDATQYIHIGHNDIPLYRGEVKLNP